MRRRVVLLAALVLLADCAPVVNAEFDEIQVSRPDILIPAAPSAAVTSVTFSFTVESGGLGASYNLDSQDSITEVELRRLAFTAKSGISDVSFIQTLHALACVPKDKTSTLSSRQVEIADYSRVTPLPPSPTFEVPLPEPVDLLPLLRPTKTEPKKILVIVNLGGALPTMDWKADVAMSLAVKFRQ